MFKLIQLTSCESRFFDVFILYSRMASFSLKEDKEGHDWYYV